jgi:plasmid stabilization system protein ParE
VKPIVRPGAQDDILRQFRCYLVEQDAPEVAFRFLDAVEASVEQLLRMPRMGSPKKLKNAALKALPAWPVKDFEEILIFLYRGKRNGQGHSHPARQARDRAHFEQGVSR